MRLTLTLLVVVMLVGDSQAGPRTRRSSAPAYSYSEPVYAAETIASSEAIDALDALNTARQSRGLRPFIRDEGLQAAAQSAAVFRAARRITGHVPGSPGDFGFLPSGTSASCAGCAATDASWGFLACEMWSNHTYAGAVWIQGADGRMYSHAFYR